jgi:hypothetical protein
MKPGILYAEWRPPEDVPAAPAPQEFPAEYPEGLPPTPEEIPLSPEEEPPAPEQPPIPPIPDVPE